MTTETADGPVARASRHGSAGAGEARPGAIFLSLAIVLGLSAFAYRLSGTGGAGVNLALSVVFGAAFGIVLQRSRFCFFCMARDFIDRRDPRGLLGIVAALAAGIAGYAIVLGAWLPDPSGDRLPPEAHVGPISLALVLGGLAFGAGMSISGSCISAHLYRLGEGALASPFALIGVAFGFVLGFLTWNSLYLWTVASAPIVWLPQHLGYAGATAASLAALAGIALFLLRYRVARSEPGPDLSPLATVLTRRWPAWLGGLFVGVLGTAAYLRVAPLGVTAEIGSRSRQAADGLGILPERLHGLDTFAGCATAIRDALLTPNGAFVGAMVLAAFAAALAAGEFRPVRPSSGQVVRALVGGVLLGWGAMTALGCSVGTLLSGISAGAASGWVFAAAMFAGLYATLVAGRRLGLLPRP